ncbi:MAG TPA: HNH endonuclease signature motif containing protein [Acidimicrobiia bacterium]|nr:HNH endonuclease signature motif containing protein [Acidimicrobiia bacterium]
MGYYVLDDPTNFTGDQATRRPISKKFRESLFLKHDFRCSVCRGQYSSRILQADHRVPFAVAGDPEGDFRIEDFMPLCPSDQRAKSYECERCVATAQRDAQICKGCLWVDPTSYTHIATRLERRVTIAAQGGEITVLEVFLQRVSRAGGDAIAVLRDLLKR